MDVRWTRPAYEDLIQILNYIAADNPAAAVATIDRIEHATTQLERFPLSGRRGSVQGTRELVLPGLPYIVIYRVGKTCVDVVRVLHGARQWPPDA